MTRTNVCLLLVLLALLLGVVSTPLAAQEIDPSGCMIARIGDSFWRIADQRLTAAQWKKLWEMNPQTPEGKNRTFFTGSHGWPYVWLGEGEKICGLDKVGITPRIATAKELSDAGIKQEKVVVEKTVEKISPWSWLPLGLLALIALGLLALYFFFRRDPTRVGSGRVREGGIHTPTQVVSHIREQLVRQFGAAQGTFLPIISLVRGRGYGLARVIDRMGSFFRRILHGEEVWQATVQLQNGQQEIRYSLLGCANDVRADGGMMPVWGFRFVPEENVTSQIPRPIEPAPAQPEFVSTPAAVAQSEPTPVPVEAPAAPVAVVAVVPEQPAPAPAPTSAISTVIVPQNRRFSFDLTPKGTVFARMQGFGNLRIEEDEVGTVTVRADRVSRNAENN